MSIRWNLRRPSWLLTLVFANLVSFVTATEPEQRFRRPTALVVSEAGDIVYVANRGGSVSVIDVGQRRVVDEVSVGHMLSDIEAIDSEELLALDQARHDVCLLKRVDSEWKVSARLAVAPYPVRMCLGREKRRIFVASLWSRTVSVLALPHDQSERERLKVIEKMALSFEPREMCLTSDGKHLIVACAFEARLAVVATESLKVVSEASLPGHNIRGMAISPDGTELMLSQQELNPLAHSTRDDIHWGNLISNQLVSLAVDDICKEVPVTRSRVAREIGEPGAGAGDPGQLQITQDGEVNVLLSGVNELASSTDRRLSVFRRTAVGRRPVAFATASDGTVFVANMFSDSVTVLQSASGPLVSEISLGPQPKLDPVRDGEVAFFDSQLSHDGWMSCHSCHTEGHTNGQLVDNLSDGSFGTPKRTLSLHGVANTSPWAWNGGFQSLDEQVRSSIENTMRGSSPSPRHVRAIVAFINTISMPELETPSPQRHVLAKRGARLFGSLGCGRCHTPPNYTSKEAYEVGLKDERGNSLFNPPSLLGVGDRRVLFHDGRAISLHEVLVKHRHQLADELSEQDLEAIIAYLHSLR